MLSSITNLLRILSSLLLVYAALLPLPAASASSRCPAGGSVDIEGAFGPAEAATVSTAICQVLQGVARTGRSGALPEPLPVVFVDAIQSETINAQFVNPGPLSFAPGHIELTHALASKYSADELAFALAHETSHQLSHNGLSLRLLMLLRAAMVLASVALPLYLLRRSGLAPRLSRSAPLMILVVSAIAAGILLTLSLSTVVVAGVSTAFEYAADAHGIELLEASGWPAARANAAFWGFLSESGDRGAGSWFDLGRHPSNRDRQDAVSRSRG
jgi:Zn-dependent protease with chaperone function